MKSEKVMALYKRKKELQEQIIYWEKFQGVNWLGKWGRSIRLERLKRYKRLRKEEASGSMLNQQFLLEIN